MITLLHVFPSSKRIRSGPRVHMIIDPNVCLRRGTDQLKEFPVTSFVLWWLFQRRFKYCSICLFAPLCEI